MLVTWSSIEQDSLLGFDKDKPVEMSDQAVVELHQLILWFEKIDGYLSLMSADGLWTDIN